jgi:hypothetical protein
MRIVSKHAHADASSASRGSPGCLSTSHQLSETAASSAGRSGRRYQGLPSDPATIGTTLRPGERTSPDGPSGRAPLCGDALMPVPRRAGRVSQTHAGPAGRRRAEPRRGRRGHTLDATMEERSVARHLAGAELWARVDNAMGRLGWAASTVAAAAATNTRRCRERHRPRRAAAGRPKPHRSPGRGPDLGLGGRRALLRHHLLHGRRPAVLPALPRGAGRAGPRHGPRRPRPLPGRRHAARLSRPRAARAHGADPAGRPARLSATRPRSPADRVARAPPPRRPQAPPAGRPRGPGRGRVLRDPARLFEWQVQQRTRGSDRRRTATAALAQMVATSEEFYELYRDSQRSAASWSATSAAWTGSPARPCRPATSSGPASPTRSTTRRPSRWSAPSGSSTRAGLRAEPTPATRSTTYLESASDRMVTAIKEVRAVLATTSCRPASRSWASARPFGAG